MCREKVETKRIRNIIDPPRARANHPRHASACHRAHRWRARAHKHTHTHSYARTRQVYTGGLDRSAVQRDGAMALFWRNGLTQVALPLIDIERIACPCGPLRRGPLVHRRSPL